MYPKSKYFKKRVFACRCGCGLNEMDNEHLIMLYRARKIAKIPMVVTSGCRCTIHNKSVGGSKTSSHLVTTSKKCCATDIECYESIRDKSNQLLQHVVYSICTNVFFCAVHSEA